MITKQVKWQVVIVDLSITSAIGLDGALYLNYDFQART